VRLRRSQASGAFLGCATGLGRSFGTAAINRQPATTAERDFIAEPPAPAFRAVATEGAVMRARHVIAIVAVVLVVVGVKLIFLTAPTAEAVSLSVKSVGVNVSQLHRNVGNLPVENFHDMLFVFSGGD
jgi:hypothetical protein